MPTNEEDRLVAEIKALRDEVASLRRRPPIIPVLEADPDPADPLTLWYLFDGRLRGRIPGGGLVEYAFSTHSHPGVTGSPAGGGSSTVPAPAPAYVPQSRRLVVAADWLQSYNKGGSQQRSTDSLYYGRVDSYNGEQMSMIHFPGLSALAAGPAGTRIAAVYFTLTNQHTYNNSGAELRLGLHNNATKPSAFAENYWQPIKVRAYKTGYTRYGALTQEYKLPNYVGERMRDGLAQGITLSQHSTDKALYGYAQGAATLRIEYVK